LSESLRAPLAGLLLFVAAAVSARTGFAQEATPVVDGVCRCRGAGPPPGCRRCRATPGIYVGLDLGVSAMNEGGPFAFNSGVGTVMHPGPAWGARFGVELTRWLAFEARYVGMSNTAHASVSPAGTVGFVTTGAEAVARFTLPLRFVHPYAFAGVGYYDVALVGSSDAKAASGFFSSSQPGVPVGLGLDVPLTWRFSMGVEAAYHWQLGEKYSLVTANGIDGGDLSTFNAVFRVRL